MKKLISVLAVLMCVTAIIVVPLFATAHEATGVVRSLGGCHALEVGQQLACRQCLNQGGASHFHPNTNTCHQNRQPQKRQKRQ